jgi:large subunit ribosomal protein L13
MTTYFPKKGELDRPWYVVDAQGLTLGRLCTEVAKVLTGKTNPAFTPHVDTGGFVVVINAGKVALTGKKWTDKIYRHHSQYPGGLKETAARDLMAKNPVRLIERGVRGMLPKNRIGDRLYTKLKVYAGDRHPHQAQKPAPFPTTWN